LFLFLLERPLQNSLRSVVSNRIGMKSDRNVIQVNTHRLTESDFRFDVTFSRWELRHFTRQSAATWWVNTASAGAYMKQRPSVPDL